MTSVAVVILTYNEEIHIERAIASVQPFAREVYVIDSGSTDATVQIAERCGATVFRKAWTNHAQQFNWGLHKVSPEVPWVMKLDADEFIESELAERLATLLPTLPPDVTGIRLNRKHRFMGRWIRFGGRYPMLLLRIWRNGCAEVEERWMDEHVVLNRGEAISVTGGFFDDNLRDLSFFLEKHIKYATLEAIDVLSGRHGLGLTEVADLGPGQAGRKRRGKRIYGMLPFGVGPVCYFLFRYFLQFGFLDGRPGAIYHFLQGGWYRFVVDCRLYELEGALAGASSSGEKIEILEMQTGQNLTKPTA